MTVLDGPPCHVTALRPRLHGVRLDHLHSFLVLAEELHFGRAARRLFVSPGGLSRRIGLLEAALGTPLLQGSHPKLRLTAAGERLVEVSRVVLVEVSSLPDTAAG